MLPIKPEYPYSYHQPKPSWATIILKLEIMVSQKCFIQAADARTANKFTGGAISNYIRLGEINMKLSQPDEAIAVINKGMALAEQIKVKPKMYQLHLLLSEIYHCKNDLSR